MFESMENPGSPEEEKKDEYVPEDVELSSEDIEKEQERIKNVISEYTDKSDENSYLSRILKAESSEEKEKLKGEVVEKLSGQLGFVGGMEDERLNVVENKLKSTIEYFENL